MQILDEQLLVSPLFFSFLRTHRRAVMPSMVSRKGGRNVGEGDLNIAINFKGVKIFPVP